MAQIKESEDVLRQVMPERHRPREKHSPTTKDTAICPNMV